MPIETDEESNARFETLSIEDQAFVLALQEHLGAQVIKGMNAAIANAKDANVSVFNMVSENEIDMPDGTLWSIWIKRKPTPAEEALLDMPMPDKPS